HYQYSYTHYASSSLQKAFRLTLLIEQFHFHDVGKLNLVHQHEYQLSHQDTSWPSLNILYANLEAPYPMVIPKQSRLLLLFSIMQSLKGLLSFPQFEYVHLSVILQLIEMITYHILQIFVV